MSSLSRGIRGAPAVLLFGLAVAGCSGTAPSPADGFPDAVTRRRSAVQVERVGRSTSDTLFQRVTGLDVDSQGRIYVGDWYGQRVVVLSRSGDVLRTFGRDGEGPGEFRTVRGVQVLRGDSLLVYDPALSRASVFAPGAGAPAYVTSLAGAPYRVFRLPAGGAYVSLSRPAVSFLSGAGRGPSPRYDAVRLSTRTGAFVDPEPIRTFPSAPVVVGRRGGGVFVTPHPFRTEGRLEPTPSGFVVLAPDSGTVERYDVDGRARAILSLSGEPPRVTAADVDEWLAGLPAWQRPAFRDAVRDSIPERWPTVTDILVDDRDRLWVALAAAPSTAVEWAVFGLDGEYRGSVLLPSDVDLEAVRGETLVGIEHDADDVPHVVSFRLRSALRAP